MVRVPFTSPFRQSVRRAPARACSALLLLLAAPPALLKAEAPASVSLDRVIQLARERAPAITAARARVTQAEGRWFLGSAPPDPQVRGSIGQGEPRVGGPGARETGIEIEQLLPSPRAVSARRHAGAAGVEASRTEVLAVEAETVLKAKRLYYQAGSAQAQAAALAEAATDAGSLRDVMNRRVELGEASEGDRLRTRVEALRTELEARAANAEAQAARAVLNRFLLGALGKDFVLAPLPDPGVLTEVAPDFVALVASRNPDYRAAQGRLEALQWSVSAERALRLPSLSLSFFHANELDRKATGAGLGISLPLWNRNQGAVLLAEGERAEAEAEAKRIRVEIESEAERLLRTERAARELAVSYNREILPASRESLSIVRFSLEQGEANLLSWLEARRSYLEILRASYRAQLDAFLLRAELERLIGGFDGPR